MKTVCLIAASLLAGNAAWAQTCTPYAPDVGLFPTSPPMSRLVSSVPATVGEYTIALNSSGTMIVVTKGGGTVATATLASDEIAYYFFYPSTSPKFLFLDRHTGNLSSSSVTYSPVLFNVAAWAPGQAPLPGTQLVYASYAVGYNPQLHALPSQGNSLALFVWFGTSMIGQGVQNANIYRSDTAASICSAASFDPQVQVIGEATSTTVRIKDGGAIKAECNLPRGSLSVSPTSQSFGSIGSTDQATRSFTLRNTGNDCLSVSAISSSAHFQPVSFSSFALSGGASRSQSIAFVPAGAVGTFNETLTITRNPAIGASSMGVSGSSCTLGTVANCGSCGNACSAPPNGTASCSAGSCTFTCNTGFTKCGGACVNTATDSSNCGSCYNSCPAPANAVPQCSAGTCSFTCRSGYTRCGNSCVDTSSDVNNCGSCGKICSPIDPNGTAACIAGSCGYGCKTGYDGCLCEGCSGYGACVDLSDDPWNCGACNNVCSSGYCSGGACGSPPPPPSQCQYYTGAACTTDVDRYSCGEACYYTYGYQNGTCENSECCCY